MYSIKKVCLILVIATLNVNALAQWIQVGTNLGYTITASNPSLVFNPSTHEPYIAYLNGVPAYTFVVQKFVGTSWTQVGTNLGILVAGTPSLVFNPSTNEPYIAYRDGPAYSFVVQKFNGSAWTQVGINLGYATNSSPSLTFNPSTNQPYIAYPDGTSNGYVVQKFDGISWTQVGTSIGLVSICTPALKFNPSTNEPYIAYRDGPIGNLVIQKFDGTSWTQVGTSLSFDTNGSPALIFNPSTNEPYIAYPDDIANTFVIQKFNGTAWTQIGLGIGSAASGGSPSLIFHPSTNELYIAHRQGTPTTYRVHKFSGTSWIQVCSDLSFSAFNEDPCINFNQSTNELYIAYPDGVPNTFVIQKSICSTVENGTDTRTECNTYSWIDGITYTSSNNTATFNIEDGAVNGCDSLVTLDLSIIYSATGTDIRTECNNYTWIDGITYTSSNDSANFNIENGAVNGCDSLVTLDLSIIYSATGTDTKTECNTYTWIDGITYTSSNDSATFNIVNGAANGCDSLVTIDLTINSVSNLLTTTSGITINASNTNAAYQWLNCDNSYSIIPGEIGQSYTAIVNGNYAVELIENNCTDTSSCVSIKTVGILEKNFGNELTLFPNPTNSNILINTTQTSYSKEDRIQIFSILGEQLYSARIVSEQTNLDLSKYSQGTYILLTSINGIQKIYKIIKE